MIFRQATLSDKSAIEELFMDMLRAIYGEDPKGGYEEDYLLRFFGPSEDVIIVAENKGEVIGYISVEVKREDREYVYIDDFCVDEKYRSRGIGTKLLSYSEEAAKNAGIYDILLHVEESNLPARRLYERSGYELLRKDNTRLLMVKHL